MKTLVYHDLDGRIRSLVLMKAPEGAGMALAAPAGVLVSEADTARIDVKLDDLEAVRTLLATHRVATAAAKTTIVKK